MSPTAAHAHQSPAASAKRPGHGRARAQITHAALHIPLGIALVHSLRAYRDARGKEIGVIGGGSLRRTCKSPNKCLSLVGPGMCQK